MLGRYYTTDVVSSLLINSMETEQATSILDLGIGNASLTIAAKKRWGKAIFYATEIERKKVKAIEKDFSFVNVSYYDSLQSKVNSRLKIKFGSIDVAICNPPYVKVDKKISYRKLFEEAGIVECLKLKKLTSEIVFFAHNLALLKQDGELGIIVSDSLITGKDYRIFRETILNNCDIKTIIQLPDRIFPKTEARTHMLILGKSLPKDSRCNLFEVNSEGKYEGKIAIDKSKLSDRMDFQFWKFYLTSISAKLTLSDIGAQISRGIFSYSDLRKKKVPFFHTTSFKEKTCGFRYTSKISSKTYSHFAKSGDIVIARVGKRTIGKVARITKGKVLVSDCIFVITVPVKYRKRVWEKLNSKLGKAWMSAYAHGVCSQVISKSDLKLFPIS